MINDETDVPSGQTPGKFYSCYRQYQHLTIPTERKLRYLHTVMTRFGTVSKFIHKHDSVTVEQTWPTEQEDNSIILLKYSKHHSLCS